MQAVNKALEWIANVAYLNILWILFTLMGAVVLGVFPATAATFMVSKKWISGDSDIPVFQTFWQTFRTSFKNANILGFIISLFGYILYLDFVFITVAPHNYVLLLTIPFLFISLLFFLTVMYVFPVFVYYEMRIIEVFKSSFFIMILNPLKTIIMAFGVFGISFILWHLQPLLFFFSISLLSIALMMPARKAFDRIQQKKEQYDDKKLVEE
ncbi:YesL family protein [Gracilibacillus oryzae]|uniref:YesL family protein n=1 Tax=Gracilibacillus oryzae TaxID=1672701 RepID=A0A7C8GSF1_9BACI|nr:YesL family protein [Gracilibacillus oryzae]KAB8131752.1 YesL family protein [Gracilibacillus oryzae]